MNDLSEHGLLDYEELKKKAENATVHCKALSTQIKTAEIRMAEIPILRQHIINYAKTYDTYVAHRKASYPPKFMAELKQTSCFTKPQNKPLRSWVMEKIRSCPLSKHCKRSMKNCWKKKAYSEYRKSREEMKE